jgi:cell division protein FtsA
MKNLICGIDIGSSKIKILVASKSKENLEIAFKDEKNSEGVRRGVIIDPEKVSKILEELLFKARQDLKKKISSAYVNFGGTHIFSLPSRGLISVSRVDQTIAEEDVNRVLQEAKAISVGQNKEVFDVIPKEFIIDGEKGIKNPIGLKGTRLEVEALALGCFSPYLENLKMSIFNSGLEILELIPSPIASARAVLTEKQKELGVCLLDLGAGTTSISVFEEGELIQLAILPIGSSNITNDIAIGLKVDPEIAERIKVEYGCCYLKGKNLKQKIDVGEEEPLIFYQKFLAKIIQARIGEIFELVNKELKKISKEKKLPAGIVLTGGGAKIPGILDLARSKFHLNCHLGKPKGILGLEEDPRFSVLAGLILFGSDLEGEKSLEFKKGFFSRLRKFLKIFLP